MSFGKDYRIVGEATITGERYGAGTQFWSALAHTNIVGRISRMVEHYAVVGEFIDKPLVYEHDELVTWLTTRTRKCLKCYPYYTTDAEPGEEFHPIRNKSATDHPRFNTEFFLKMKEIGLGWKEFQLYYKDCLDRYFLAHPDEVADDWSEEKIYRWNPRPSSIFYNCLKPERFVKVLDEIAANRRRLLELPAAK